MNPPDRSSSEYWRSMGDRKRWHGKRRFLFFRFLPFILLAFILLSLGTTGLIYIMIGWISGGLPDYILGWFPTGLVVVIPLIILFIIFRAFTRFANPFARIMAAADNVAEGDFSVRVPEPGPGELGRLARSFNRMVSELEKSDRLRRNLTADVAHELRTPLHIIQGNLEALLDGIYPADPEHINLLLDETRNLTRLVEDLRTLSLAEAGQLPMVYRPVKISELFDDIATSFSGQAEVAGVNLMIDPGSNDPGLVIQGDAGRLDQVLTNLVANALRHTPQGGSIHLKGIAQPDGVNILVTDNGSGISPQDLPFIFDRFWRGDHRRQETSGLGLAIARRLVEAHHGIITVESQPAQGTTFTINLPYGPVSGSSAPG